MLYKSPGELDKILEQARYSTSGQWASAGDHFSQQPYPSRNTSFGAYCRKRPLQIALAIAFVAGVWIGAVLVRYSSQPVLSALQTVLGGYLESRKVQPLSSLIASGFSSLFLSLLALFFCGFCSIAQPVIFAIPLFKGLGYGFSIGMLCTQYGIQALWYIIFLIFPGMFCSAFLLVIASRASFRMSVHLFRTSMHRPGVENEKDRIKRYCIRFLLFTALCLAVSLLDAVLYIQISPLIHL